MLTGEKASTFLKRADSAKTPRRGWCDCPKPNGGIDHAKIAAILGAGICLKCNRRIKPE